MNIYSVILYAMVFISICILSYGIYKSKNPVRTFLGSAVSGLLTFGAVGLSSTFTGVFIGLNLYSIVVAAVVGIPGVIFMLLINLI